MLPRVILPVLLLWLSAGGEGTGISATLRLAPQQDASLAPYRQAELAIQNRAARPVESVRLVPAGGGPAVQYRLTIHAGGQGNLLVALPAYAPVQDYRVQAFDQAGQELGSAQASVVWPSELVSDTAFVSDAYKTWLDASGGFSAREKGTALLLLCIYAAAAIGVCFVPHPVWRALAGVAVAIAGAIVIWQVLQARAVVAQQKYTLTLCTMTQRVGGESFSIVTAKRLARPQLTLAGLPYRVYPDRQALHADESVVIPAERKIELSIAPAEAAVVKSAGEPKLDVPATREVGWTGLGREFLVKDDNASLAEVAQDGQKVLWRSEPVWLILQSPERFRLDPAGAKLFLYWRQRHQRADRTYRLLFTSNLANHVRLLVIQADDSTKPQAQEAPMER